VTAAVAAAGSPLRARAARPRAVGSSSPGARLRWLVGLAILGAVVAAALHASEGKETLKLLLHIRPWGLVAALALQAATYGLQAVLWISVARAAGVRLPFLEACRLSLAKLFVDQALPSAGISGTVLVAGALERRGLRRPAFMAMVAVNLVSFYGAYVAGAAAALAVAASRGGPHPLLLAAAGLFVLFAAAAGGIILYLPGRRRGRWERRLAPLKPLSRAMGLLRQADPRLSRAPGLHAAALALQGGILLLDAATVHVFLATLGASLPFAAVFAAVMAATLFRTVGVSPGGLGTFEAACVVALKTAGASVPAALSATLLFRALSYWLPMAPGFWFSRRLVSKGGR
jgi:uncharacterized membrane protein YbhN (UPF0104 family)